MKSKIVALILAITSALTIGTQSAFAADIYVDEQRDTQNNSPYTPELFTEGSRSNNPFVVTKTGALSSVNDSDWYLIKFLPETYYPGASAYLTLVSPHGDQKYDIALTTDGGSYVQKEWIIDNEDLVQVRFNFDPSINYHVRVYTNGDEVSPFKYQLTLD